MKRARGGVHECGSARLGSVPVRSADKVAQSALPLLQKTEEEEEARAYLYDVTCLVEIHAAAGTHQRIPKSTWVE